MLYIILLFILILCWTINPFLKKIVMKKLNAYEFFLYNNLVILVFLILYLIGLKLVNNKNEIQLKKIYELNKKEYIVLLSGGLVSLIGAMMFLYLIKMDDITKIVSFSQSLTIILSIIVGYMFFSEKIFFKDLVGILLIVGGITLIKYKGIN